MSALRSASLSARWHQCWRRRKNRWLGQESRWPGHWFRAAYVQRRIPCRSPQPDVTQTIYPIIRVVNQAEMASGYFSRLLPGCIRTRFAALAGQRPMLGKNILGIAVRVRLRISHDFNGQFSGLRKRGHSRLNKSVCGQLNRVMALVAEIIIGCQIKRPEMVRMILHRGFVTAGSAASKENACSCPPINGMRPPFIPRPSLH